VAFSTDRRLVPAGAARVVGSLEGALLRTGEARYGYPHLQTPAGRIPNEGPRAQTPGMAAMEMTTRIERRFSPAGATAFVAATSVDAASVDREPGASVTPHLLWAQTMLALLAPAAAANRQLPLRRSL
jgi:hypothetical protein